MPQSFTTLQSDLTGFLDNADISADLIVNHIIPMAEQALARNLDVTGFDTFTTGTLTVGGTNIGIPTDLVKPLALYVVVGGSQQQLLEQKSLEYLIEYAPSTTSSGTPVYYGEEDASQYRIAPYASSAFPFRLKYRRQLAALTSGAGASTNWLTENAYDALHAGAMRILARYLQDDTASNSRTGLITIWDQRYVELVNQINGTDAAAESDEFRIPTLPLGRNPSGG